MLPLLTDIRTALVIPGTVAGADVDVEAGKEELPLPVRPWPLPLQVVNKGNTLIIPSACSTAARAVDGGAISRVT